MTEIKKIIHKGAEQLNIDLSEQQSSNLINYIQLLIKWNKVYNLTSIRDPQDIAIKHILDSLSIIKYIDDNKSNHLLDIGTGGGLPGIVLAIMLAENSPESTVTLLDSNSKKTAFLNQVKIELKLSNVTVVNSRIENYSQQQAYSVIVSRAFSSLKKYIDYIESVGTLVNTDSTILAMKAKYSETQKEIKEFELGCNNDKIYKIEPLIKIAVPFLQEERCLVKILKK